MKHLLGRWIPWMQALPAWGAVTIVLVAVALITTGGVAAYRTYDFIEHDNEFCLSCHLMVEPFEAFAQSAHRGLGCKACHKPTFLARSQMGMTQVLENPDSLAIHAEVPNEKCASCHIDGDPETWETIRTSAGHRVHLESNDPTLQGLNCVECHSTGVHEFAAVDQTCAQSDCHTESRVQLGAMSDLTIHCVACHGFSTPVEPAEGTEALFAAVTPDSGECLSCHAMRTLVDMPEDEPHDQSCGTCHNPHEQTTPAEAVATCATASCHSEPEALSPLHVGVEPETLVGCATCHGAHDWSADGEDCLSCHTDATATVSVLAAVTTDIPGPLVLAVYDTFEHTEHDAVECLNCHVVDTRHDEVSVVGANDCRACHHQVDGVGTGVRVTADQVPECVQCHQESGTGDVTYSEPRTITLSTGAVHERSLPFNHGPHESEDCASCHTEGLTLSAVAVDCTSCHEEHHAPESVRCASCHVEAPVEVHPVEQVHVGCTGSGCHTDPPVQGVPRTRDFCLTCHQDLEDHRPEESCEECHQLPAPRVGG